MPEGFRLPQKPHVQLARTGASKNEEGPAPAEEPGCDKTSAAAAGISAGDRPFFFLPWALVHDVVGPLPMMPLGPGPALAGRPGHDAPDWGGWLCGCWRGAGWPRGSAAPSGQNSPQAWHVLMPTGFFSVQVPQVHMARWGLGAAARGAAAAPVPTHSAPLEVEGPGPPRPGKSAPPK